MARFFSITRAHHSGPSDSSLLEAIRSHTDSDAEASSILGCIERLGDDPTIRCYEMTPRKSQRTYRESPTAAWTVRAVRP
jgi:hypothetical protein